RQDAGRLEEGDEGDRLLAGGLLLDRRADANAVAVLLTELRLGDRRDAAEPAQRVGDLVGFEAHGGELASELLVPGASVRTPVVLVEIHEDVEHKSMIPQRFVA